MKKKTIFLLGGATLLLAVLLTGLLMNTGRGSAQGTLQAYYTAMYTREGTADDLCACIAAQDRQTVRAQLEQTDLLFRWHDEALLQVGEQIRIEIRLLDRGAEDAKSLNAVRETYPGTEQFSAVGFELKLTGSDGWETLTGVAPMLRQQGKWYLTGQTVELTVTGRSE